MSEEELLIRMRRVSVALDGRDVQMPEAVEPVISRSEDRHTISLDFRSSKTEDELYMTAMSIISMLAGLKDRTKKWLKSQSRDGKIVDEFIDSHDQVAIVQDLANADKHGTSGHSPVSGQRVRLGKISMAIALAYDPAAGEFAESGEYFGHAIDLQEGKVAGPASSSNLEQTLTGEILDENGDLVSQLEKALPQAAYDWETFLVSLGLNLQ